MNKIQTWIQAARPKTLIAGISPVIIGSAIAFTDGAFDLVIFLFTLLTSLGIQISCNLINDYADFLKGSDTALRQGPLRVTSAGLVSVSGMKRAAAICIFFTALFGSILVYQGGIVIALLLAISLLLAYFYTVGPFPLAYLGLGEIFVLAFFGPIAVAGTAYLQTGAFSLNAFIAGFGPGALSTAILVTNNLRDAEEDTLAHKKTLIVRFGKTFGKCEYLFCILLAFLLPFYFMSQHPFILLASLIILPAFVALHSVFTQQDFRPLLPKTAQMLMLYTILFSIGWML